MLEVDEEMMCDTYIYRDNLYIQRKNVRNEGGRDHVVDTESRLELLTLCLVLPSYD